MHYAILLWLGRRPFFEVDIFMFWLNLPFQMFDSLFLTRASTFLHSGFLFKPLFVFDDSSTYVRSYWFIKSPRLLRSERSNIAICASGCRFAKCIVLFCCAWARGRFVQFICLLFCSILHFQMIGSRFLILIPEFIHWGIPFQTPFGFTTCQNASVHTGHEHVKAVRLRKANNCNLHNGTLFCKMHCASLLRLVMRPYSYVY